jgi:glycerophosphoryl diester phosphodiesterase
MRTLPLLALAAALLTASCVAAPPPAAEAAPFPAPTLGAKRPIVIAHRGASGELPEHTLAAYARAIEQGADCIEPDLVMTKDGVLVARHDIYLSTTTDVADRPEFADRKRAASSVERMGQNDPRVAAQEDWWIGDFTLAELKTLRARQPFPGRSQEHNGKFEVPTFDEVLALAAASRTTRGERVCVYPEAKASAAHSARGFDMAMPILDALARHGYADDGAPVFIQSFEPPFVSRMNALTELPVVMLIGDRADYDRIMAADDAPFWDGLGLNVGLLFNADGTSSGVIEQAHAAGVPVHAWTFRDDAPLAAAPWSGEASAASLRRAFAIGLDGAFTDHPATGVAVVREMAGE